MHQITLSLIKPFHWVFTNHSRQDKIYCAVVKTKQQKKTHCNYKTSSIYWMQKILNTSNTNAKAHINCEEVTSIVQTHYYNSHFLAFNLLITIQWCEENWKHHGRCKIYNILCNMFLVGFINGSMYTCKTNQILTLLAHHRTHNLLNERTHIYSGTIYITDNKLRKTNYPSADDIMVANTPIHRQNSKNISTHNPVTNILEHILKFKIQFFCATTAASRWVFKAQ